MKTITKILILSFITLAIILCGLNTASASNDTYIIGTVKDAPGYIDMEKTVQVKFDEKDINNAKKGKSVTKIVPVKGTIKLYKKTVKKVKKTVKKPIYKTFKQVKKYKMVKMKIYESWIDRYGNFVKSQSWNPYQKYGYDAQYIKSVTRHYSDGDIVWGYYKIKKTTVTYVKKIVGYKKVKKTVKKTIYKPKKYKTRFKVELTKGWDKKYPLLIWLYPIDVHVGGTGIDPIPAKYYVNGVLKMYYPGGRV